MKVRGALSFVAFAAIIALAFSYFTSLGVNVKRPTQRINISMEVPDINGLVVGSSVQLRGVPIGAISSITTSIGGATVNFYLDGRYKIPANSDVRLANLSALGEAYIGLIPRSDAGPTLQDGQRIAAKAITNPPSISDLATAVVRVLNQLDPAALDRIINETDAALPNPTPVLPNLARAATLLRNTAANMNGKGRELLDNFQALFRNAAFVGPVLAFNAPYVAQIGRSLDGVYACAIEAYNRGAPKTVYNFSHFVTRVEHLLDHSSGDIKVLQQAMLPYLNDISGALMNLDTGQIFANMLAALPEDGAVTLHVTIPGPSEAAENPGAGTVTSPAPPALPTPAAGAITIPTPPAPQIPAAGEPTAAANSAALTIAPCRPVLPAAAAPRN